MLFQKKDFKRRIDISLIGLIVALIIILIVFKFLNPYFLTYSNIINIFLAVSVFGIAAAAQTAVVISGGLDLSQESIIVASGVAFAVLNYNGFSFIFSLIAGILIGPLVGLINGIIITKLKINPVIATLAMMAIIRALFFEITGAKTTPINNEIFLFLGTGRVGGNLPLSVVLLIIVFLLFHFILSNTIFGRRVYAVGGDTQAAILAGINADRIKIIIYIISGTFASFAGLILASIVRFGVPIGAQGIIFKIIAVVFLGGTAISGGRGKIAGTFLALLIFGTISNGLVMINVGLAFEDIFVSVILLISVALSQGRLRTVVSK